MSSIISLMNLNLRKFFTLIRIAVAVCMSTFIAQSNDSKINSDNIIYSSEKSDQQIYLIIPANKVFPVPES